MKRRLRKRQILELLQSDPELSVEEACERLGASPATVRREFVQLAAEGRVEKTWGGIRATGPRLAHLAPPAFAARLEREGAEKKAIARAAGDLLKAGDVVMIDGGTTTYQLAEFIAPKAIRVITNSLVVAQAIDQFRGGARGAEIHLTGGQLEPESGVLAGPQAEASLRRFRADWVFFSAAGVDAEVVSNYDQAVLASEQTMIAQAAHVGLLADHTKIGGRAMSVLCPVAKVTRLITGRWAKNEGILRRLARAGIEVTRVDFARKTSAQR